MHIRICIHVQIKQGPVLGFQYVYLFNFIGLIALSLVTPATTLRIWTSTSANVDVQNRWKMPKQKSMVVDICYVHDHRFLFRHLPPFLDINVSRS